MLTSTSAVPQPEKAARNIQASPQGEDGNQGVEAGARQTVANPLTRKLERFAVLGFSERLALDDLESQAEWVPAGTLVSAEGETSETVIILLGGFAYRHKDFLDGRRQIITLLMLGDICGTSERLSGPVHYGVRTLTKARIARIDIDRFRMTLDDHPAIASALHKSSLVDEAVLRAWIVNLGQRHARERVAHLLCELAQRMTDCGLLLASDSFKLPLTQQELGSVLGLTSVHINRVLQQLRAESLIEFQHGVMRLRDLNKLQVLADFNPDYLLM